MRSFQLGVSCLDPGTNPVPVPPFGCLLEGIHVIPEAYLGSDLQAKIPDRITGRTAFGAVIGSAHRTCIKLHTGPAYVSIEDRMEGTTSRVVAA